MSFTSFEKNLVQKISSRLAPAAPGIQIQVHQAGRKISDLSVGETYPYYDFASLTKIIFTTQAMMKAFDDGLWNSKSTVKEFLPWFQDERVLILQLLNHSSGLPWWFPFFEKLEIQTSTLNKWNEAGRLIRDMEIKDESQSVYSDVGFIVLGHLLESLYEKPLAVIWEDLKERFYPRSTLNFHPGNKPKNKTLFYAPTERSEWRAKLIQGEVHDDNTWALDGVSSHAGLFGSIDDLGWFAIMIRSQLKGHSKTEIRQKTAKFFAARSRPEGKGDWALGYMMPTPGSSSSGTLFSKFSIGHTGFTGTSFWYDPIQDLSVVILSNRVFLGRDNKEFAQLRPQIHNWIVEGLRKT
jgi:CubicO group peptidase (beta-lactamase class C family)